jgi:tRNA pseudouridine13 synthase
MTPEAGPETQTSIAESDTQRSRSTSRVPSLDTLHYAHGGSLATGRIRAQPEDFVVREFLGFEATGEGEHLLLTVRKRGANSKWVARQIAAHAGVRVREVGLAGLKDRHAITEQSFTVPALKTTPESWLDFGGEGFAVIAAARQRRKLRRGAHQANDFEIVIRDFDIEQRALETRLEKIAREGVPNYFGEQRFGHDDHNLEVAEQWLCQGVVPADRDERSFALSAARSALFNAVLSRRVAEGTWNRLLPGEVVNLDGSGSVFVSELPDATLDARCAQLDIHPTGPLCGIGDARVRATVLELEEQTLAPWSEWRKGLERLNVEQQRRSLRLAVGNLTWEYASRTLKLRFRLTRGAFATAVLRELTITKTNLDGEYE